MSHEIYENAFIEATHGGRVTAWHGIGTRKDADSLSLSDLLGNGINFRTDFASLRTSLPLTSSIPPLGHARPIDFARAIYRTDTGAPLSIVGNRYEITQHVDFFTDVDAALGGALFETAGVLRGGREVFALVQAGQFAVKGKDLTENFVFFRTSYDGTSPTKAKAVNTRVVCANTTAIALTEKGTSFDYSFRHTASSADRIKDVLAGISKAKQAIETFHATAERMASEDVSAKLVQATIMAALEKAFGSPIVPNDKNARTVERQKKDFTAGAGYMAGALSLPENRDMGKWGLYNAVSQWTDHDLSRAQRKSSGGSNEEKRMDSILDGRADDVKQEAFAFVTASLGDTDNGRAWADSHLTPDASGFLGSLGIKG